MNSSTEEDLNELYGEIILEHFRDPKNKYILENADVVQSTCNPLCGDELTLYISFDGDTLSEISFQGHGCSISQAGASMLIEDLLGKSKDEALSKLKVFSRVLAGEEESSSQDAQSLEESRSLYGVRKFAARIKCAMLAWEALNQSLNQGQ
jgi:nitrogen fixation NifU-like protein